ncbi:sugar (glycoside-pentoside-Hexuronide) transporter [Enterococcus casseliflavus]|uniref:MFS transporter n=1 Tax=Enterococcus casseliflavus TaxID=37734 RepID=UPI001C45ADF8|nr:MFS transporter [Enterococcus casseliflavus]MBV6375498.1 sugar (glycoside-pentoside-Hexuronide) transporter [Enterococcus casseliflavus]
MEAEKEFIHENKEINKMTKKDYLGDAAGMFGLNIILLSVGQLTYFYTDKLGLSVGLVGICLLVVKIAEAFTGIIFGNMIDKSKKGNSKYTDWMGRLIIPAGIVMIMMFTVPTGVNQSISIGYVLITNFLITAVIGNLIGTPYASLQVVRTKNQQERAHMGTFRAIAAFASGMIISISIIPITNLLGGDQVAWIKFGGILTVAAVLFLTICYFSSKGKILEDPTLVNDTETLINTSSLKNNLLKLFKNKYWVMVLFVNLFLQLNFTLSSISGVYYVKWIFGNDNLVAVLGSIGLIPTIVGFILTGPMAKKFGVMGTLKISAIIGIVASIVKCLFPANLAINIGAGLFVTFSTIPAISFMGVMAAMAIDYNEYLYKDKFVALSNGAIGFGNKLGGALATVFLSASLSLAKYSPAMTSLTTESRYAIYAFANWLPLVSSILVLIVYTKFDLEKKLPDLLKK